MSKNVDTLFALLRVCLSENKIPIPLDVNWQEVLDLAGSHNVVALAFGAFEKLPANQRPQVATFADWLGQTCYAETLYEEHQEAIWSLAKLYEEADIKMVLLKGNGLSLNYPIPSRRPIGDIDVFLCGDGKRADELVKGLGIVVKQNEDKHSTFPWMCTIVENHACFIADIVHPCLKEVEEYLETQVQYAVPYEITNKIGERTTIYLPSVAANAVFLPLHTAAHFFHEEITVRQLCDWATFVMKNHKQIGWNDVETLAEKAGFYPFLCCLNGIIIDYLGVPEYMLPKWNRDKKKEKKILQEILKPRAETELSLSAKVVRFFKNYWKYKMIFNENFLLASIRQARSYLLITGHTEGKNIWD